MIEIVDLSKSFTKTPVFNPISFQCHKNEITCLIGQNGAGKTTLINIIADLIPPDTGHVLIDGKANSIQVSENVRFHFDDVLLIVDYKVKEYFGFIGYLNGLSNSTTKYRADQLISFLNLNPDKRVADLSKGQKVKCSIGVLLLMNINYLVLDEPFVHLDIQTRAVLKTILNKLRDQGTGILITSHDIDIITSISDRILHLHDKKITEILDLDLDENESQHELTKILNADLPTINPETDLPWLFVK